MSPRRLIPAWMTIVMVVTWAVMVSPFVSGGDIAHAAVTNAWSALGTFNAAYTNTIDDLLVNGSDVYVAGQFTDAGGVSGLNYLAKWNGSSWGPVGTAGSITGRVNALAVIGNFLYVGGSFTNAGGVAEADGIAKFDMVGAGGWSAVGEQQPATGLGPLAGTATVYALEVDGTSLLVGGAFTDARSLANTRHVARYTPSNTTWTSVAATAYQGAAAFVASIAVVGSVTYIGYGNVSSGNSYPLMMYDNAGTFATVPWGATWSTAKSFVGGDYPGVYALHADGTDLYVGGNFAAAGSAHYYLAKFATGSSTWTSVGDGNYCSYGSYPSRCIRSIAKTNGSLYVVGDFGASRINTSTNFRYDLGLGSNVTGLGVTSGVALFGGQFTDAGGVAAADYLAKFSPATTSGLDSLSISAGSISPVFSSGTTAYSVSTEEVTSTITASASNSGAGVSYSTDGGTTYTQVATGQATTPVPLSLGSNTLKVKVDPSDSSGTASVYTLTVTRAAVTTTSSTSTTTTVPVSVSPTSSSSIVSQSSEVPATTAPTTTNAPTTTSATQATTVQATSSPSMKAGKLLGATSILRSSGGTVPSGAKVVVVVSAGSVKVCRVSGSSVKALKPGTCRVTITVTPKKGKPAKKTVVLKVN